MACVKRSVVDELIESQQGRIAELEQELERSLVEMNKLKVKVLVSRGQPIPARVVAGTAPKAPIQKPKRKRSAGIVPASALAAVSLAAAEKVANSVKQATTRYWTTVEHEKFLLASRKFGPKNYAAISQYVGTRNPKQVRTHAQKYEMRLAREDSRRKIAIYSEGTEDFDMRQSLHQNDSSCSRPLHSASNNALQEVPKSPPRRSEKFQGIDSPLAIQALADTHMDVFDVDSEFESVVEEVMAVPNASCDDDVLATLPLDDTIEVDDDCTRWLMDM